MIDKKKLHFWQIAFVFSAITVIALFYTLGHKADTASGMMEGSMGSMMSNMHLKNVTIRDLIVQQELKVANISQDNQSHSSHHSETAGFLETLHYLTTSTIVILLPFIIAGTVFLAIIWHK